MATHNPRQFIEDLRGHLAAHDRPLVFLFGAGTSCAVNAAPPPAPGEETQFQPLIPGIEGLTDACRDAVQSLGELYASGWSAIERECSGRGQQVNVENALSRVRMKLDAIGEGERLVGLDSDQLGRLEGTIRRAIAALVAPAEESLPCALPHDQFASWIRAVNRTVPLEIFTTNYDVLFERSMENARLPVFDGFPGAYRPFFHPECLEDDSLLPGPAWVRIWKLHGSVNWRLMGRRVVRGDATGTGEMILPSHRKYDESLKQPYRAFMDRLSSVLRREHALLITSGYSFGDEHINAIIFGALDNRITTNVIALQFCDCEPSSPLVSAAQQRPGFSLVCPTFGILGAQVGEWRLSQALDARTRPLMEPAFLCAEEAPCEDDGNGAASSLSGQMELGDFNSFCQFLTRMGCYG